MISNIMIMKLVIIINGNSNNELKIIIAKLMKIIVTMK